MAGIIITKLIREHHEHLISPDGSHLSVGQSIDDYLAAALDNGDEVQEVSFQVSPEEWHALRQDYHRASPGNGGASKKSKARPVREGDF